MRCKLKFRDIFDITAILISPRPAGASFNADDDAAAFDLFLERLLLMPAIFDADFRAFSMRSPLRCRRGHAPRLIAVTATRARHYWPPRRRAMPIAWAAA